jgi:hypothetical protein
LLQPLVLEKAELMRRPGGARRAPAAIQDSKIAEGFAVCPGPDGCAYCLPVEKNCQ